MNKIRVIALVLILLTVSSLAGCVVRLPEPQDISSADEARIMGFTAEDYDEQIEVGDYQRLDVSIKIEYKYELWWSSSDDSIATVDSGGRVDGLKPGRVTVTAHAKKASIDFDIEVVKAEKKSVSYTTAITANEDYLADNRNSTNNMHLYALLLNAESNCITVYTYNSSGNYNVAVRSMVCSLGSDFKRDTDTNLSESRNEWYRSGDKYHKYATLFGDDFAVCSTPYSDMSSASLEAEDYNKLGANHKGANVWLSVADAKWVYDNCESGTRIFIRVESKGKDPIGVPSPMTLTKQSPSTNWDPTDDQSNNPYSKLTPSIVGVENVTIKRGSAINLHDGITAYDTCNNPAQTDITIDGTVDIENEGTYIVAYIYTDPLGRTVRVDRAVTVE